jgi:hypothetical protein
MLDLDRILDFIACTARLLERRRMGFAVCGGDAEAALTALADFPNPDGGFGWAPARTAIRNWPGNGEHVHG